MHASPVSKRKNPGLYSSLAPPPPEPAAAPTSQPASPAYSPTAPPSRRPEVLAPAGGWPQLRAAVENGADAVYFGVSTFNARARAANFSAEELPAVMAYLHERGAKGYLVLNVLVFDGELTAVAQLSQRAAAAGVDALIVQDVGVVELVRAVAPGLPVHGSTQMTITSAEGAAFAAEVGRGAGPQTPSARPPPAPLVFVGRSVVPQHHHTRPDFLLLDVFSVCSWGVSGWWWGASCRCARSRRWRPAPAAPRWRPLCTARCASPTAGSASAASRGAGAAPTGGSARRRAD